MLGITCPDLKKLAKKMDNFSEKQLPFAATKTVNDTAFDAKREIQKTLDSKLKLKNKHTAKGIAVKKARKNKDLSKIQAVVYNKDSYLAKHEKGGSKSPKRRSHAISVDSNVRTKRGYYKKRFDLKKIGNIEPQRGRKRGAVVGVRNKPSPFKMQLKSGKGAIAIKRGRGKRSKLKILYHFHKKKTRYKARGVFSEPGIKIGKTRMLQNARRNLILAYNTAR